MEFLKLDPEEIKAQSSKHDAGIIDLIKNYEQDLANVVTFSNQSDAAGFYSRFMKVRSSWLNERGLRLTQRALPMTSPLIEKGYTHLVGILENENGNQKETEQEPPVFEAGEENKGQGQGDADADFNLES